MKEKIAILRLSALGDCVMLLPAIQRLKTLKPDADIYWLIEAQLIPLFQPGLPDIHFIALKKPRSFSDYWALRQTLKSYRFDSLLALQASLRSNLIYPLIHADRKIGFDKARANDLHAWFVNEQIPAQRQHILEAFLSFADYLFEDESGIQKPPLSWGMKVEAGDLAWFSEVCQKAGKGEKPLVALNPAASKPERCASVAFYRAILEYISQDYTIILTGGPAEWEKQIADEISQGADFDVLNLVGKTSYTQLAAVLQSVDLLIAPDTGPIHLADALGTRTLGLYAVAPPELTGPYQNQQWVINKYPQALETIESKRESEVPWGHRIHHKDAMTFFELDEFIEMFKSALSA